MTLPARCSRTACIAQAVEAGRCRPHYREDRMGNVQPLAAKLALRVTDLELAVQRSAALLSMVPSMSPHEARRAYDEALALLDAARAPVTVV